MVGDVSYSSEGGWRQVSFFNVYFSLMVGEKQKEALWSLDPETFMYIKVLRCDVAEFSVFSFKSIICCCLYVFVKGCLS